MAHRNNSIRMALRSNGNVVSYVNKYLLSKNEAISTVGAVLSFATAIGVYILRQVGMIEELANPYVFYPIQIVSIGFTIYSVKNRIRPSGMSNVRSMYVSSDIPFMESKSSKLPTLKGFISNEPNEDSGLESEYLYIPISDSKSIENISAYDLNLEDYFSKGKEIKLSGTQLRSEREIFSALKKQSKDIQKYQKITLYMKLLNKGSFFNSQKVSLVNLEKNSDGYTAELGRTSYFTTVLTNDLFTRELSESNTPSSDIANLRQHYPARKSASSLLWRLNAFGDCDGISNHVGSAVLAITKDCIPIIQRQGVAAQQYPGKIHVSGAGSLELSDLNIIQERIDNATFSDFVKYGMSRELLEETGFVRENSKSEDDISTILEFASNNICLLSVARDVKRGGLPIFLGFAKLNCLYKEVRKNKSNETTIISEINSIVTNGNEMNRFIGEYIKNKDASSQLILFKNLLERKSVRACFDKVAHS